MVANAGKRHDDTITGSEASVNDIIPVWWHLIFVVGFVGPTDHGFVTFVSLLQPFSLEKRVIVVLDDGPRSSIVIMVRTRCAGRDEGSEPVGLHRAKLLILVVVVGL